MLWRSSAVLLPLLPLTTGCATIVGGGSSQPVSVESAPSAARYVIRSSSGLEVSSGSVPASIRLPRKNEYQLEPAFVNVALESTGDQDFALVRILDEDRKLLREERLLLEPTR
jgi:hypothetical protein